MSRQLAELLVKEKVISSTQFDEAIEASKTNKEPVRFLIEKKYVSETKLLYYLSQKFGLPSINLAKFEINPEVVKVCTPDMARKCQAIPIQMNKGTLVVAIYDPVQTANLENLKFALK